MATIHYEHDTTYLDNVVQDACDDWDSLFEDLNIEDISAIDIKIDHVKMLEEINANAFISLEKKVEVEKQKDYKICPQCNVRCKIYDASLICESCGLERDWQGTMEGYNESIDQNYSTSKSSYVSFNLIGNGSYCYQRSFLKTCASYSSYRTNNNKKEIVNIIYQYENSKPPINVINTAADLFDRIVQSGRVYRKNGKKGVMAACLDNACSIHGVARTPRDISTIMNIDEKLLSQGNRILQELNELGIIEIPTRHEPTDDYLNQFFPALGIPDKYKAFVVDLITRAEKKHLHIRNDSKTTTKCVGAIYILTMRVKSLRHITKDTIAKECNKISRATFIKYQKHLYENHELIKKSFKRHAIPMPSEWKK